MLPSVDQLKSLHEALFRGPCRRPVFRNLGRTSALRALILVMFLGDTGSESFMGVPSSCSGFASCVTRVRLCARVIGVGGSRLGPGGVAAGLPAAAPVPRLPLWPRPGLCLSAVSWPESRVWPRRWPGEAPVGVQARVPAVPRPASHTVSPSWPRCRGPGPGVPAMAWRGRPPCV